MIQHDQKTRAIALKQAILFELSLDVPSSPTRTVLITAKAFADFIAAGTIPEHEEPPGKLVAVPRLVPEKEDADADQT